MDSANAPIIVLLIALAWGLWRAIRPKTPRMPPSAATASTRTSRQPSTAPTRWLARWHVHYRDFNGETTERIVRVVAVQPRLENLQVWCELRSAERTLKFAGLKRVADAETGEIIDMRDWLQAYSQSRRKTRTAP